MHHKHSRHLAIHTHFPFLAALALMLSIALPAQGPPPGAGPKASIQWFVDGEPVTKITRESFAGGSELILTFESNRPLQNVFAWLTPSLADFVEVSPAEFAMVEPNTPVEIALTLLSEPESGFGGTIHIKQHIPGAPEVAAAQNNPAMQGETMRSRRTFGRPLPVSFHLPGEPEEVEAEATAVVNAADFRGGGIAPGEVVSVFGRGLGPAVLETLDLDSRGRVSNMLGGTQILFDGLPAPIFHARSDQMSAVVPFGVEGQGEVVMIVTRKGAVSLPVVLPVVSAAPAIFSLNATGQGQGAILNSDFSVNGPSNRASKRSFVSLFGTGAGSMDRPTADGELVGADLPRVNRPVSVKIGGVETSVLYAGGAPGLAHGVVQVNVMLNDRVPAGAAVPVTLSVGNAAGTASVTIAIE